MKQIMLQVSMELQKINELIAHPTHIHNLPCTGLGYFTVYGLG